MENSLVNIALPSSKCPTPEWTDLNDHDTVDYRTEDDPGYYGLQPGEDPVDGLCGDIDAEGKLDDSELAGQIVTSIEDKMDTTEAQAPIKMHVTLKAVAPILAPMKLNVAALSLSEATPTDMVVIALPPKVVFPKFRKC
ncbi:hypothetical protein HYPSUDRAFT_209757 [Hypholoma sublateritium FD-334 SS-4]|uniref:Uncharacterized protein n=1 Tax=Hypholoma sublateritium (strain FD-334 SS-4) TaxID=945553 RepID=A0A0D2N955_HYPSF|nr:hypothetical protein HYPSUDRAFT_209757 [Hypholoma sublateritium FD-334 SS-4]